MVFFFSVSNDLDSYREVQNFHADRKVNCGLEIINKDCDQAHFRGELDTKVHLYLRLIMFTQKSFFQTAIELAQNQSL